MPWEPRLSREPKTAQPFSARDQQAQRDDGGADESLKHCERRVRKSQAGVRTAGSAQPRRPASLSVEISSATADDASRRAPQSEGLRTRHDQRGAEALQQGATSRTAAFGASAHAADDTVNTATPMQKTRRLCHWSPGAPPGEQHLGEHQGAPVGHPLDAGERGRPLPADDRHGDVDDVAIVDNGRSPRPVSPPHFVTSAP